jgi:diguanylate cyclase (GGDEF)-like protein
LIFTSLWNRFLNAGSSTSDSDVAGRVRAVQISVISRYTPWMLCANIANVAALLAAFWGGASHTLIAVWAAAAFAIVMVMAVQWYRGRRATPRTRASLKGIKRAVTYALVLGGLWALPVMLLYESSEHGQRMVLVTVTAGMMAGGGFALATVPPAAITFAIMVASGAMTAMLTNASFSTIMMALLLVSFVLVIIQSSLTFGRIIADRTIAQHESDAQRNVISLLLNEFEESASDWLFSMNAEQCLRHVSPRYCDIMQMPESSLIGRPVADCLPTLQLAKCTPAERNMLRILNKRLVDRLPFRDIDIPIELRGERLIWSFTGRPVFDASGAYDGFHGVARDVTAAREASRKIEHMAKFDALTGLPNRVLLRDELDRAFSRHSRKSEPFALLMIDLDHFKMINDTQGHPVGDMLLIKVAERLKTLVRDHDTVARLGGDEFAIVLTMLHNPQEAANLGERITKALAQPFQLDASQALIGASVGISFAPDDALDSDTLIRHADLALYRAKNDGRGACRFFEPALDDAVRRRHRLEADLRSVLESTDGGLTVHYQPLIDTTAGDIRAFEALARWQHPEFGMISPAEFIPLAEETGLIQALGARVLADACGQAQSWPADIRISVNLSPVQFRSPSLFTQVRQTLEDTGLQPDRLELEITESLLLDSSALVESTLASLKGLGARVVLDDFGTGYSSLSYLRKYRFDKIKIDRSFIDQIDSEPEALAIVDGIIRIANDLGIALTAEGVETEAQLTILKAHGCSEAQGFLISRPVPADQATALLTQPRAARKAKAA